MKRGFTWAPPPRILVAAGVAVLCVTTVLAILGAFKTGITTDEPIHVMRLRNYFDNGWYALDWDYRGAGPGGPDTNTFVYAPVTMLLLHAWSVLGGVEGWGEVSTTPHAYDMRHLGVVLIGLAGLVAVAAIGRIVLRHWRWGIVAAAALSAIPLWTGHEMFNVKDIPVATGHTLVTLGLLLYIRERPAAVRLRLVRALCLISGMVLALGTRPAMWTGLFAVMVIAIAGVLLGSSTRRSSLVALAEMAGACVIAAAALVAIYPPLFGSPLKAVPRTTETSSSFLGGEKLDRLYVPRYLAAEMPALLLLFMLTGAVVGAMFLWKQWRTDPVPATRIGVVGVQAFAMPVVAIILGSDLYHGLRQLLFFAPAAAVLIAYGMAWLLQRPARGTRRPRGRLIAAGAVAALVLPAIDQITLQPYQTTYVNLASDVVMAPFVDDDNRPGGDFWRVSLPELVEHERLDRQLLCKATVDKVTDLAYPFTNGGEAYSTSRSLDCREETNGPLAPSRLAVDREPPADQFDAVFLKTLPKNCTKRDEVTRWRHGFETVLTILGRCTVVVPPLDSTGVSVEDPVLGTGADRDLWRFATDGWLQWPGEHALASQVTLARLAFRPEDDCARTGCTLLVHAEVPPDLVVRIGDEQVATSYADETLLVPVSAAQASSKDGVWVTLTRESGERLGMRLTGLSLRKGQE